MSLRTLFLSTLSVLCLSLVSVKDCSTPSALFSLKAIDISPSNPVPGENGTLHMTYFAPEDLAGGTVDYTCTLNGFPVLKESYDLCTATTCPITVGEHDQKGLVETPDTKGTLGCSLKWSDSAKRELLCVKITYVQ
jgi:hypothetical protein